MRFGGTSTTARVGRGIAIAAGVGGLLVVGMPFAAGSNGQNLGPAQVAGPDSVPAKAGKPMWAVVDPDGTLARGKGVASAEIVGTGTYIVHFTKNVRACSYVGTIGLSGASGTSADGFITTVGAAADVNGVFVTTDNTSATRTNLGFHLQVQC